MGMDVFVYSLRKRNFVFDTKLNVSNRGYESDTNFISANATNEQLARDNLKSIIQNMDDLSIEDVAALTSADALKTETFNQTIFDAFKHKMATDALIATDLIVNSWDFLSKKPYIEYKQKKSGKTRKVNLLRAEIEPFLYTDFEVMCYFNSNEIAYLRKPFYRTEVTDESRNQLKKLIGTAGNYYLTYKDVDKAVRLKDFCGESNKDQWQSAVIENLKNTRNCLVWINW